MSTDELREFAEAYLYDGDLDRPLTGYMLVLDAADELDRLSGVERQVAAARALAESRITRNRARGSVHEQPIWPMELVRLLDAEVGVRLANGGKRYCSECGFLLHGNECAPAGDCSGPTIRAGAALVAPTEREKA